MKINSTKRILNFIFFLSLVGLAATPLTTESTSPEQQVEELTTPNARAHHYLFVHHFLPAYFYSDVVWMDVTLQSQGANFITEVWSQWAEKHLKPEHNLPGDGISVQTIENTDEPTIHIVQWPKPQRVTEAYFTAMLIDGTQAHYYTLEMALPSTESEPAQYVLAGWLEGGKRVNYGLLIAPEVDTFTEIVSYVNEQVNQAMTEVSLAE